MKRMVVLVLFSFASIYICAQQDFSRWSLSLDLGLNKFDGDIPQSPHALLPSSYWGSSCGIGVNYQITKVYGLFINYNYIPINALTKGWNIKTQIHTMGINSSIDFTHLMFPYSKSRLTFNGSIGIGFSGYCYNVTPLDLTMNREYGLATMVPISFYYVYNCSDYINIGLKMTYISFNKDDLEGVSYLNYKGVSNDKEGLITLLLTYKF